MKKKQILSNFSNIKQLAPVWKFTESDTVRPKQGNK